MCGIFALLNSISKHSDKSIYDQFIKGKKRGPEFSEIISAYMNAILGFHRLAINGINNASNQPLQYKNMSLICNGEIYNYKELYRYLNVTPTTDSDCEIIIHLYIKFGINDTLKLLDGVFAFLLLDNNNGELFV